MQAGSGAVVDISDLGTLTRILFATDGSITHILEAYASEAVDLVTIASSIGTGPADHHELDDDVDAAARSLRRLTLLRGQASGRVFVHASSVVRLDRLPEAVAEAMCEPGAGLLNVLTQSRIGTFRESVGEWTGTDEGIAACLGIHPSERLLARTYQVVVGGVPVAWVTETFPKDGFTSPPAAPEACGGTT